MNDADTAKVGDRIYFDGSRMPFTVQARSRRYIIATRPFAPRKTVLYTVVDLHEGVRGPDNLIFCMGYETRDACIDRLNDLKEGLAEVSHRKRVPLGTVVVKRALAAPAAPKAPERGACDCEYSDCKHRKQPPGSIRYFCDCGWWNWVHPDAKGEWVCPDCKRVNVWPVREPNREAGACDDCDGTGWLTFSDGTRAKCMACSGRGVTGGGT